MSNHEGVSKKGETLKDLLQPEILSNRELILIFKERNLDIAGVEKLDHDTLVDLYYKNVIPMPQRSYRRNRRGQTAARQQVLIAKRKRSHNDSNSESESYSIKSSSQNNARFLCSFDIKPAGDRLKPPPSAINPNRKIIVLNSKTTASVQSPVIPSKPDKKITVTSNQKDNGHAKSSDLISLTKKEVKSVARVKLNRSSVAAIALKSPTTGSPTLGPGDPSTTDPIAVLPKPSDTTMAVSTVKEVSQNQKAALDSPSDEEGIVRKKFKSVSITWP